MEVRKSWKKTHEPRIWKLPEFIKGFGRRRGRDRRRKWKREVGGEKAVPKRVLGGEAMEETGCDGDAAEILVGQSAVFDTDFENFAPEFVGERGHFRKSTRLPIVLWPFQHHRYRQSLMWNSQEQLLATPVHPICFTQNIFCFFFKFNFDTLFLFFYISILKICYWSSIYFLHFFWIYIGSYNNYYKLTSAIMNIRVWL